MRRALVRGLAAGAWLFTQVGCSPSNTDCTCAVEIGGERRTLVCGESACVGGVTVSCLEKDKSTRRSACMAAPPPTQPDAGTLVPEPFPEPDRSCEALLSYCNTGCSAPASTSADCQATASAGDARSCAAWPLANGASCRP